VHIPELLCVQLVALHAKFPLIHSTPILNYFLKLLDNTIMWKNIFFMHGVGLKLSLLLNANISKLKLSKKLKTPLAGVNNESVAKNVIF